MWGALMLGAGVFLTLLIGLGTAWAVIKIEMSQASRRLLRRWAIYCCLLYLIALVVPGVLGIVGTLPSTPVVAAVGFLAVTVVFAWLFMWLGNEWQKLNPRKSDQ